MTTADDNSGPQGWNDRLIAFLEQPAFKNSILILIIFNAITLGMTTSDWIYSRIGPQLDAIDRLVLGTFVVEISLKLIAYRLRFFRDAWNWFDLFVVVISLFPASKALTALRGLRVLRAMRLLSALPQMRKVIQALLDALPGMGAVILMLCIIYYVFSVMATIMYGDRFEEWFGTIGLAAYSLFQIMTLESWSMGIVRPVMEEYPYAWAFFVPFIIITAFSVLNLFIGLLVTAMESAVEEENEEEFQKLRELVRDETDEISQQVTELTKEVQALRAELAKARGESPDKT